MTTAIESRTAKLTERLDQACEYALLAATCAEASTEAFLGSGGPAMSREEAVTLLGRIVLARQYLGLAIEELGKLEEDIPRQMIP